MKESAMSVSSLVGAIDDIARCSSVLAEGIEGGNNDLCDPSTPDTLFLELKVHVGLLSLLSFLEFIKFVAQQEECRKKWLAAENEAIRLKQDIAKITVPCLKTL